MLRLRILTAAIGLPLVLLTFVFGPDWLIFGALMVFLTLCVFEAARMILPRLEELLAGPVAKQFEVKTGHLGKEGLVFLTIFMGWLIFVTSALGPQGGARSVIVVGLLVTIVVSTFIARDIELAMAQMLAILFALCYGALPWIAVWDLYLMGDHSRYILLMLAIVWMGDTGGYFGGRALGGRLIRTKMSPHRSPNKTWEGAASGIGCSVLGAFGLNAVFAGQLAPLWVLALVAVVGGIAGQLGDLVESTLKRFCRVKDSGSIVPGHGGFLDRVDGILFAAPACWSILYFFK
mgnify:CR=1 FL=1